MRVKAASCCAMGRCAAFVKGEAEDLQTLLVGGGFVAAEAFEAARERARGSGLALDDTLESDAGIAAERVDSLRREHVERAVLRMFTWRAGQFSFEVRDELEARDLELSLPTGINAQYLTMEATRLRDEKAAATRCSRCRGSLRMGDAATSRTRSPSSAAKIRKRRGAVRRRPSRSRRPLPWTRRGRRWRSPLRSASSARPPRRCRRRCCPCRPPAASAPPVWS
jgi:hypothetical protein